MIKKIILLCALNYLAVAARAEKLDVQTVLAEKLEPQTTKTDPSKTIRINYNNEELLDIIYELTAKKNINPILPIGANSIATGAGGVKVTFSMDERVSLDEAWNILYTILDVAGYSMIPKDDMVMIVKNSNTITREPLPIYIATPVNKLPDSDQRIRYVHYFTNLKVPTPDKEGDSEINSVLKLMLDMQGSSENASKVVYDPSSNGVILADKANNIRAAVSLLAELDRTGFKEVMEIVKIINTSAENIRKLLMSKDGILGTQDDFSMQYQQVGKKVQDSASYFSKNVKAYTEGRSNSLILLGRQESIARVVKFIKEELDKPLESGRSILHVYQLQYLDAKSAADVLSKVVGSDSAQSSGQSRAEIKQGTERFFKNVLINADSFSEKKKDSTEADFHPGSNKLLITCTQSDWEAIKRLIEEIDIPQPQVILEVLVADITIEDPTNKLIASITRTPQTIDLLRKIGFQAANFFGILENPNGIASTPDPQSLNPDLLGKYITVGSGGKVSPGSTESIAATAVPGSTMMAFGDKNNEVWSLIQVLQKEGYAKILSNPHLIAINNKKASVEIGESKLVQGKVTENPSGGSVKVNNELVKANLKVEITPLINSKDQVNLKVKIDIDEFNDARATGATEGDRITRNIYTEANVKSGEVLTLGGLVKTTTQEGISGTPVLSKLPIVGWLFKRRSMVTVRSNLTVFITPTIIQPKLRGGMSDYTQDYIKLTKRYAQDIGLFDTLRDPITRWFFTSDLQADVDQTIDSFTRIDELKSAALLPADPQEQSSYAPQSTPRNQIDTQQRTLQEIAEQDATFKQFAEQETGLTIFNLDKELATAETQPENNIQEKQMDIIAHTNKDLYEQQLKNLLQFEENPLAKAA